MSSWGASGGFGSTQGSNLFGNSTASNTNSSGGLFGSLSKPQTTTTNASSIGSGLFGNSNTQQNTQQQQPQQQLLLFGGTFNKPATVAPATGGLFGSSTGTGTSAIGSSGLFGASNPISSAGKTGIFGNTGGLSNSIGGGNLTGLGNSYNATTMGSVANNNPYQQNLVNVQNEQPLASMPPSITGQLFQKEEHTQTRRFSYLQVPKNGGIQQSSKKSGLLGRLAQAFKNIRNPTTTNLKGLFTQSNVSVAQLHDIPSGLSGKYAPNKVTKQTKSKLTSLEGRDLSNIRRLIIKSKPLKYHQIDANEVFSKRRAHVTTATAVAFESNVDITDEDELDETDVAKITARAGASKVQYTVSNERIEDESKIRIILKQQEELKQLPDSDNPDQNNGYWTSPPISELVELSEEELLNVKNFIIGRNGYGQIAYDHSVDLLRFMEIAREEGTSLAKVLFERIFSFDKKVVLVYPDENEEKPTVGNGVNVPATITLENIAPKEGQSSAEFIEKLKNMVGAEFITYDPIAKRWIFKVLHFSVWGLIDEDDLTPQRYEKLINIKRKQDKTEDQSFIQYQNAYQADIVEQELKKQRLNRDTHGLPGAWGYDATQDTPLNVQRNEEIFDEIRNEIETYKENKVTQDLSKVAFEDELAKYSSDESSSSTAEVEGELSSSDPASKVAYLKEVFNNLPPGTDLNEIVQERVYEPEITNDEAFDIVQGKFDIPTADDWLLQLELTNNLDSPLNPQLLDLHSGKPSQTFNIAHVDDILFGDFNRSPVLYSTPIPEGPRKDLDSIELPPVKLSFEPSLIDVFLSKVEIKKQPNNYPQIALGEKNLKFSDFQQAIQSDFGSLENSLFLKLASALFDVSIGSEFEVNKIQRESFGSWLADYNKPLLKEAVNDHRNDKLQVVLDYLYYGDLKLAVEAAWETSNPHLSPVLVLLDSNDKAAIAIAQNQLESWRNGTQLESIPAPVVKVYQILAREIQQLSSDLPWNMVFSLKLLYDDPSISVNELIQDTLSSQTYPDSLVIELLKLYNIWSSKKPDALQFVKKSSELSITLKWLIQEVLFSDNSDDGIDAEFGDFLLTHELWMQALVAYTCLSDIDVATKNVRNVVLQNILKIDESLQLVLVQKLQIPRELLAEARALQQERAGELWESCEEFMNASLWDEAHRIIAEKLGPAVVISNSETSRRSLLDILNKFPSSGSIIPTWNTGSGIYENYCKLVANNEDLESLLLLLQNLPFAGAGETKGFNEKVALKLVSKFVGDVAIAHSHDLNGLKSQLDKLYLGESEKQYFNCRLAV